MDELFSTLNDVDPDESSSDRRAGDASRTCPAAAARPVFILKK
jgi:hypothetical protein